MCSWIMQNKKKLCIHFDSGFSIDEVWFTALDQGRGDTNGFQKIVADATLSTYNLHVQSQTQRNWGRGGDRGAITAPTFYLKRAFMYYIHTYLCTSNVPPNVRTFPHL